MKKCLILLLFVSGAMVSCKKTTITYPIEGYWVGKYGSGTAAPSSGYSMVVEPGGVLTIADGSTITSSSKATGTWTLTGNTFKLLTRILEEAQRSASRQLSVTMVNLQMEHGGLVQVYQEVEHGIWTGKIKTDLKKCPAILQGIFL